MITIDILKATTGSGVFVSAIDVAVNTCIMTDSIQRYCEI